MLKMFFLRFALSNISVGLHYTNAIWLWYWVHKWNRQHVGLNFTSTARYTNLVCRQVARPGSQRNYVRDADVLHVFILVQYTRPDT